MSAKRAKAEVTHNGYTWQNMPGRDPFQKRLNFAAYRRGVYDPCIGADGLWKAERQKSLTTNFKPEAADAEKLMEELEVIRAARGFGCREFARYICETCEDINVNFLDLLLKRKRKVTERSAVILRAWMGRQAAGAKAESEKLKAEIRTEGRP